MKDSCIIWGLLQNQESYVTFSKYGELLQMEKKTLNVTNELPGFY